MQNALWVAMVTNSSYPLLHLKLNLIYSLYDVEKELGPFHHSA